MKKILTLSLFAVIISVAATAQAGYHVGKTFRVASPGGWDYPAIDPGSSRLYLSHGTQVNILDRNTGDSVGVIPNTTGVHGIAFVNALGKGYVSSGRLNSVTVFDLKTGTVITQVPVGKNPDWITYDPYSKKVIAVNHTGGDLSLIDPSTDKVVATIAIGGVLETAVSNNTGKLFVNVEDKSEIVEVDMVKNTALRHWSLAPGEGPTGLAIDLSTQRLFATCDQQLVVMDATNGNIVTRVPIGNGCDGAAFDPSTKLIFTSNGEGNVSVVKEMGKDEYKLVETVTTKRGARTITIDEKTHKLYLPTADFEPLAADAPKGTRPKMIAGSFQVLVLERK